MKLYTSLTRLKMAMNGGTLPPVTSLTARARGLCDPAFALGGGADGGMGGLQAHSENGLRCPIRGCGKYFHHLGNHLRKHGISPSQLREVLSIPQTAHLISEQGHAHLSTRQEQARQKNPRLGCCGRLNDRPGRPRLPFNCEARRKARVTRKRNAHSVGMRNMTDTCDAQLREKLMALTHQYGRSPTAAQVCAAYGPAIRKHIERVYGSFNACKEHLGFQVYGKRSIMGNHAVA